MVYWFSCCSKNDDYTVLLRSQSVIELYVFSNCEVEVPSVADVKSEFPFFFWDTRITQWATVRALFRITIMMASGCEYELLILILALL